MLNFASFRLFADSPATYSARAVDLVERSLVIDMLAVLKINFLPEAYATPLTEAEIAAFSACGITGFNNAVGTGGPAVVEETLSFLAAWQGFCARNSDLFCVVDTAADLDRAKAAGKMRGDDGRPELRALPRPPRTSRPSTSSASAARSSPTTARTCSAPAARTAWTAASATTAPRSSRR